MKKKSFWQKIIGTVPEDEQEVYETFDMDEYEEDEEEEEVVGEIHNTGVMELPVDVYDAGDNIIIEAFIPGVPLEELNIELAREQIIINGSYGSTHSAEEYFIKELQRGDFERSISLPEEVDIDASSAVENSGVLKITLPKFNKSRRAKLQVKSLK